jgi:hypothetical protein
MPHVIIRAITFALLKFAHLASLLQQFAAMEDFNVWG